MAVANDAGRVKSFFPFFLWLIIGFEHTSPSARDLRCGP